MRAAIRTLRRGIDSTIWLHGSEIVLNVTQSLVVCADPVIDDESLAVATVVNFCDSDEMTFFQCASGEPCGHEKFTAHIVVE